MHENRDALSPLPTSPFHSPLNLPRVRGARIPRGNTEVGAARELPLPRQLTRAINDRGVARWQLIRGVRPPPNIQPLINLAIRRLPTGKPSDEGKGPHEIEVRAVYDQRPDWEIPI